MHRIKSWAWLGVLSIAAVSGCDQKQDGVSVFNPFGLEQLFGMDQPPVRIGIVAKQAGILDPNSWDLLGVGSPWNPLRDALQKKLKRPVQFEQMKPFQIAANLKSGRLQFAFLSADDYEKAASEVTGFGNVLAVSEIAQRQGYIVANAHSSIEAIPEISGRRFAFGPPGDPVLDEAAKETLQAAGLPTESIAKELFSLNRDTLITVNSLQHHLSANESAYEIAYLIGTDAGVIEAADYAEWPDTGGSMLLRTFAKDQFRILGKTAAVEIDTIQEGPFVASTGTEPKLVDQVTAFLLNAKQNNRKELRSLGLAQFSPPQKKTNSFGASQFSATSIPRRWDEESR